MPGPGRDQGHMIVNADTAQELDEVLPVWLMIEITITRLMTFGPRRRAVLSMRERLARRGSEDEGAAR
jgi:hypothetical protein